jgi:hypothetical protein
MSLSSKLNHLINKTFKLINNIEEDNYSDDEEREYKFSRVIDLLDNLIRTESSSELVHEQRMNLLRAQFELERVKATLVGDLSPTSEGTALAVIKKFRAQLKGLYTLVSAAQSRDEYGELDDSFYEQFEPFVDSETGHIIEEQDTEVRDACANGIFQNAQLDIDQALEDCTRNLSELVLTHKEKYRTKIDEVDVYLAQQPADIKREKRIHKTTTQYFTPTVADMEKLAPKIEKSVSCRKKLAGDHKKNNLGGLNSREVILTMLTSIKQLKREGVAPVSSEEYLQFSEETSVRVAHMPSEKNLSNVFINHLGTYGRYKKNNKIDSQAVLSIFEAVEAQLGQDRLVEIMLVFGRNPAKITFDYCALNDTVKNQILYRGFIRALTLVFQAEIWRYQPIGTQEPVRNISFAMALAEGVELLEDGVVELEDLFDADAEIGLPTGQKILQSFDQVKRKQKSLQALAQKNLALYYSTTISDFVEVFPEAQLVPSKSLYTDKLQRTFGKR